MIKRLIIATAALLAANAAKADTVFPSMSTAAIAGLASIQDHTLEYAGIVEHCSDGYYFSVPKTSGSDSHFVVRAHLDTGCKMVAIFHNHPVGTGSEYFSPNDCETANQLRVTSYILVEKNQKVLQYNPGDATISLLRANSILPRGAADGKLVKG